MLFFLFAAFIIHATNVSVGVNSNQPNWLGVVGVAVLFISILLHEIGQVVFARRLGGMADEIIIGPLGGLNGIRIPYEPQSELVAIMAGTLVNAAICFVCGLALVLSVPSGDLLLPLLKPSFVIPIAGADITLVTALSLILWINWSLILINLIPAFPFDGGRSLNSALAFLWPEFEAGQSHLSICRLGKILAVAFVLLACTQPKMLGIDRAETWFAFALIGIYVFFNSRREELQQAELEQEEETEFGYDFSQGYTSLERGLEVEAHSEEPANPPMGLLQSWLERRRAARRKREKDQEIEDEKRVDDVLQRLHEKGMRSLSKEDRALLDRVSERYRSRQD